MYRVYVVDDEALILDEIVKTVPWLDNGFEVVGSATSPLRAVEEIVRLLPDVVFSDLKMPDMDGLAMFRRLKALGVRSEFVMLSAFGTFQDSRSFFLMEGFDYLLKPIQQSDVQLVLERLAKQLAESRSERPEGGVPQSEGAGMGEAPGSACCDTFDELVAHITEHYTHKHTLAGLSAKFHLNETYICNLFSRRLNTTLTRYVTGLRMAAAADLMRTTDKAYKEIAISCGYSDYYYFCKVFKDFFGASPTRYCQHLKTKES